MVHRERITVFVIHEEERYYLWPERREKGKGKVVNEFVRRN
jgi:hypothetical protein